MKRLQLITVGLLMALAYSPARAQVVTINGVVDSVYDPDHWLGNINVGDTIKDTYTFTGPLLGYDEGYLNYGLFAEEKLTFSGSGFTFTQQNAVVDEFRNPPFRFGLE